MITIDQLLESVNYPIEPKWVTKDKDGTICIFGCDKPEIAPHADFWAREEPCIAIYHIKLADFENKPWSECIYEVPRKTTGKIKQIVLPALVDEQIEDPSSRDIWIHTIVDKIAELVDAVNELKGAKNE